MAMVNGKIVGSKVKKIKDSLKKSTKTDKPSEKDAEVKRPKEKKAKKNLVKEGWENFKSENKAQSSDKKKKKTRKETSEPEMFRIQIGAHGFLSVDLADDDAGSPVVQVRKWYNTQKDPEIKPGKGGFNLQATPADIKLLAARLKAIAIELEAKG